MRPSHASLDQRQLEVVLAALVGLAADTVAEVVATEAAATEAVWAEVQAAPVVPARSSYPTFVTSLLKTRDPADSLQLPFQVGWQDLKDLFRQAGTSRNPSFP